MPLEIASTFSTVLIRKSAFDRLGLTRADIDSKYGLTADEFRLEGELVAIGPLPNDDVLRELIEQLENDGAEYYEEFFELSGNWPAWLRLFAMSGER